MIIAKWLVHFCILPKEFYILIVSDVIQYRMLASEDRGAILGSELLK